MTSQVLDRRTFLRLTGSAAGYEGPSFPYGGYLRRGFNDLNWLPDPPEGASPKVG